MGPAKMVGPLLRHILHARLPLDPRERTRLLPNEGVSARSAGGGLSCLKHFPPAVYGRAVILPSARNSSRPPRSVARIGSRQAAYWSARRTPGGCHLPRPVGVGISSRLSRRAISALESPSAASSLHAPRDSRCAHRARPAEPDALRTLHGESVLRALTDQAPLELGEGRENGRHHLARGRRGIDTQVEGDQVPTALARLLHERREVEERTRETIQLGYHERLRFTPVDGPLAPPVALLGRSSSSRWPRHPRRRGRAPSPDALPLR